MLFAGKWMELEVIVQDKPVLQRQVRWLIIANLTEKSPLKNTSDVGEGISRTIGWGWKTNPECGQRRSMNWGPGMDEHEKAS